jgi:hypothetical protein
MDEYYMYRHLFDSDEEFWAEKRRIDAEVRAEMNEQLRKDLPFLLAPFVLLFAMIIVGAATASP